MSCINSIWVTKIGIDGLNGEDCRREGKSFSVIISAQEFQALPSLTGCCDDIPNTKAFNWLILKWKERVKWMFRNG